MWTGFQRSASGLLLAAGLAAVPAPATLPNPMPLPGGRALYPSRATPIANASAQLAAMMPGVVPPSASAGRQDASDSTVRAVAIAPSRDLRVTLEGGRSLILLIRAGTRESYDSLASRYLAEGVSPALLAAANPGRTAVQEGTWYRAPLALVSLTWREKALLAVFPGDRPTETGWVHRPGASPLDTYGEGAWEAALWFTGDGRNFEVLMRANRLADPLLPRAAELTIPAHLLLEPFRTDWAVWVKGRETAEGATPLGALPQAAFSRPSGLNTPAAEEALARSGAENPAGMTAGRSTGMTAGRSAGVTASRPSSAPASSIAEKREDHSGEDGPLEPESEETDATGEAREGEQPPGRPGKPAAPGGLEEEPGESPPAAISPGRDLTFSEDAEGPCASYRLKRGEALYSAVVVRYTGRLDPDDVSEAAAVIARRSGIRDVTDIPVGFAVRIPRSMLLPEFLPSSDLRRREFESERREADSVRNTVRSKTLDGIHVILDAGHGGVDPGATIGGVAEHEYAYDVVCRIKRLLETTTSATVHPTIEDPSLGFAPRSARILRPSGDERILTTPAHVNADSSETSLGVNLRWFLANSIERRLVREGCDPARTVFASFHADVLHPSLRGAMVYVPGERYRRGTFSCRDTECSRYAEVREAPVVRFDRAERVASEGLSRQFAARLVSAFGRSGVRVHPDLPVRDRIIRRGRDWLPAVLRGNTVPVKVLVEMVNLNNPSDRTLIQDAAFRQRIAEAFVQGLLAYYGAPDLPRRHAARATRSARAR